PPPRTGPTRPTRAARVWALRESMQIGPVRGQAALVRPLIFLLDLIDARRQSAGHFNGLTFGRVKGGEMHGYIAATLLSAALALAPMQGTTGSLSGVVTDESKGALPGATVTVKDLDTGQSRALTTDEQGRFRADALAPGKYAVTVELSGFRTAEYTSLNVS